MRLTGRASERSLVAAGIVTAMSYSFTANGSRHGIATAIRTQGAQAVENIHPHCQPPTLDHIEHAAHLAQAFADQLGPTYTDVIATISGHANVNHDTMDGWSDECVTVTLRAVKAQPEAG